MVRLVRKKKAEDFQTNIIPRKKLHSDLVLDNGCQKIPIKNDIIRCLDIGIQTVEFECFTCRLGSAVSHSVVVVQ